MSCRKRALYENAKRNRKVALNSWYYGWRIDPIKQREIAEKVDGNIREADEEIGALLEQVRQTVDLSEGQRKLLDEFNPSSSQQVARLFYEILDEPIRIRTEQGAPSSGKAALEGIARSGGEVAQALASQLKKRTANQKLRVAYINNLDGLKLVRTSAHVTAQVAGRWSVKDPALQTIPSFIKPMFVARPGQWMALIDYAGAEYRTMALQAGCQNMLKAFNEGRDVHKETGAAIFQVSVDKVTPKMRKLSKGVGLGFHYSVLDMEGAAAGLYGQVGHQAKDLTYNMVLGALKNLAKARHEIIAFKHETWRKVQELDYVEEPLLGRRRYFYGKPKDTEAYNFAQQAMIAAMMDKAVQGVDAEFTPQEGLYLQRHDEMIIGGPDPVRLAQLAWKHMRQTYEINGNSLTFEIEIEVTRRWGESVVIAPKKLGTEFEVECCCQYSSRHDTLESAVKDAANHYDECEKMEGGIEK